MAIGDHKTVASGAAWGLLLAIPMILGIENSTLLGSAALVALALLVLFLLPGRARGSTKTRIQFEASEVQIQLCIPCAACRGRLSVHLLPEDCPGCGGAGEQSFRLNLADFLLALEDAKRAEALALRRERTGLWIRQAVASLLARFTRRTA